MSDQQPPTGSPQDPADRWPRRFDPETGRPLDPAAPAAPAAPTQSTPPTGPGAGAGPGAGPGADSTQYVNYQPSPLPAPGPESQHGAPAGWQAPAAWGPPESSGPGPVGPGHTDALGRTVDPQFGTPVAASGTSGKKVALLSTLAVALVASVATGTFLLLQKDDQNGGDAAGGGTSATSSATDSPTPSATDSTTSSPSASGSASPSDGPSTSATDSPSATASPSTTGSARPTSPPNPTRAPAAPLKNYGAQFSISEFSDNWNFRLDDVELSTRAVSAQNFRSCAAVSKGQALAKAGCRFAGETIQENASDGVRVTTMMLQFGNEKQATQAQERLKAGKTLSDRDFNLTGRVMPDYAQGMWRSSQADKFVVVAFATTGKKIDERLLNRYASYRANDIAGALRFMVM